MRRLCLGVCLGLFGLAACMEPGPYHCAAAADCTVGGEPGFCEADGRCSAADGECPSGRRYGDGAAECVPGEPPLAAGRHCLPGVALPESDPCAAMVCATRPWCCDQSWSESCVHAAETTCELHCSAHFAGGAYMFGGAGSFDGTSYEQSWSAPAPGWVFDVAWGDFDSDGHPDLAVAREQQNVGVSGIVIYPFNFSGPPLLGDPVAIGGDDIGTIFALEWVDYRKDGKLDLLAGGPGGVYLIVQDDGGAFTSYRLTGSPVDSVGWVDPDGAAPWMLAIAYGGMDNPEPTPDIPPHIELAQILEGDPPTLDAGSPLGDIYTGDLVLCSVTGGPARDLLIGSYPARIASGNGVGYDVPTSLNGAGYEVECADLDRDGDDDVVLSSGFGDPVDLMLNSGGLNTAMPISSFTASDTLDVGDVDGDHDLDVVTSSASELTSPLVFLRNDTDTAADPLVPMFEQRVVEDWSGPDWTSQGLDLGPRPPPPPGS